LFYSFEQNTKNFSTPYLSFPLVILTRKNAPYIGGIEDLHGKTLATINKNAHFYLA